MPDAHGLEAVYLIWGVFANPGSAAAGADGRAGLLPPLRYGTGSTARQCQQQCAGIDGEEFPLEPPRKQAHPLDRPIVAKGRTIPLMVQQRPSGPADKDQSPP
jgi:hypothetical protein